MAVVADNNNFSCWEITFSAVENSVFSVRIFCIPTENTSYSFPRIRYLGYFCVLGQVFYEKENSELIARCFWFLITSLHH